jgi:hypothetical protein
MSFPVGDRLDAVQLYCPHLIGRLLLTHANTTSPFSEPTIT